VVFLDKRSTQKIFIKVTPNDIESTLQRLQAVWKQSVTHRAFEYHFLDDDYEALYRTEQRTAAIFTSFSTLAIILACLGLFALTAYAVVQRTKEIGIRKVLGATITQYRIPAIKRVCAIDCAGDFDCNSIGMVRCKEMVTGFYVPGRFGMVGVYHSRNRNDNDRIDNGKPTGNKRRPDKPGEEFEDRVVNANGREFGARIPRMGAY
jgi:hypothetical protein